MDQAVQAHREGRLPQAASLYRTVLESQPDHARALGLLGLVEHDLGRSQAGIQLLRRSVELEPASAAMQSNLGTVLAESGLSEQALEHFLAAIRLAPDDIGAIDNTILLLRKLNRLEDALPYIEKSASLQPNSEVAQFRLAISCLERQDHSRAYDLLHRPPLAGSRLPGLNLQKAIACLAQHQNEAALQRARLALNESPQSSEVAIILARSLVAVGRTDEAVGHFRRAISLGASSPDIKAEACLALMRGDQLAAAEALLAELVQEKPALARELNLKAYLASKHWNLGDNSTARRILLPAHGEVPSAHERLALSLMIPQIPDSVQEIDQIRRTFEASLDELLAEPPRMKLPNDIDSSNFYLAFHGRNNKTILGKFSNLCRTMDPSTSFVAPHCESGTRKPGPTRIGFLSRFVMHHPVSLCFSKIVETISADNDFDVFLISNSRLDEEAASRNYAHFRGTKVQLNDGDVSKSRQTLSDLGLDILVFMDIGMDHDSYVLALSRLAPIQCVLGGHPDTTGIGTIDYFVSSEIAELPEAPDHYSEKLALIPKGAFYFERPKLPKSYFGYRKNRVQLGLPATGHIYICPAMLQKLHPEFDFAINQLLARDPQGHVVLFLSAMMPVWNQVISRRLDQHIDPALRNRVHLLPFVQDGTDFANTLICADVILDPFHFGLGSTTAFTAHAGTPSVSMPTTFLRGRTGYFFSKLLDTPECLADSPADYVERAVAIAQNSDLRDTLSRRIMANSEGLFDNLRPVHDFVDLLRSWASESA